MLATTRRWKPTPCSSLLIDPTLQARTPTTPPVFPDDRIIAADLWGPELAILSAGMGFDGVIGLLDTDPRLSVPPEAYYVPECADALIVSGQAAVVGDVPGHGR